MPTTEIHVPISLNRQFATQTMLLVRSIAERAQLPGDWRVVLTVSRDTEHTLDTSLMGWTRDHRVELRWVEERWWQRYHWAGTGLQMQLHAHDADVVLFMDADTVVVGPLTELVESVAADPAWAAWPAWQPPVGLDLDAALLACGISDAKRDLSYSGFGLAFAAPRHCPPYFNLGFVAVEGELARAMAQTIAADFEDVAARFRNWYSSQVAACVNILRHRYPYRALDMRYNLSNGDWDGAPEPRFDGVDESAAAAIADALRAARAAVADPRVLHYCVQSAHFSRARDMDGLDNLRAFCQRKGVDGGSARLQRALLPLIAP